MPLNDLAFLFDWLALRSVERVSQCPRPKEKTPCPFHLGARPQKKFSTRCPSVSKAYLGWSPILLSALSRGNARRFLLLPCNSESV